MAASQKLMSADEAHALARQALRHVTVEDAVVTLYDGRSAVTRFAGDAITQNIDTGGRFLSVSVAQGGRVGSASAATTSPDDIAAAVRRAEEIARLAPPDPEYLPPLGPQTYGTPPRSAFDEATNSLSPEVRAEQVRKFVAGARKAGLSASGTVESSGGMQAIATSRGLFASFQGTSAAAGCTLTGKDSTGWARTAAPSMSGIDTDALVADAVRQARLGAAPLALAPGRYTTILLPPAVGSIVGPVAYGLSARGAEEGVTFLAGKVGQKLVGSNITLRSEPFHPLMPDTPFNGSGVPVGVQTWIDKGVFQHLSYDRFRAKKAGVTPNPLSSSLLLEGTDKSVEDLIKGTERGVLLTHFWYVRTIKPEETTQTGMTRDSLFWIEDGKIAYGLKHMRWNESSLRVLSNVLDLSRPRPAVDTELGLCLMPALKVADFNFVSGTEF